jgi:hypothetical protein
MIINPIIRFERESPNQTKGGIRMDALVWYEIIGIWGLAALVIITDQKNWKN